LSRIKGSKKQRSKGSGISLGVSLDYFNPLILGSSHCLFYHLRAAGGRTPLVMLARLVRLARLVGLERLEVSKILAEI